MKKTIFSLIVIINLFFVGALTTEASSDQFKDYNYNFWLETVPSTPSYYLERVVDIESMPGVHNFQQIVDVHAKDDKVFIVDRGGHQVIITDNDFNFQSRITLLRTEEYRIMVDENTGNQLKLSLPESVYLANNGDLYVTVSGEEKDTGGARIIVFSEGIDQNGNPFYYTKKLISEPDNFVGRSSFTPTKIVVDDAGRIYTVIQGGSEGIVVLNADGSFSRFFGLNRIRFSPIDYFWRSIASEEQLSQMSLNFAPPFNNIDIDENGFIYATNADPDTIDKIARYNPSGDNIIRAEGYLPPGGDISFMAGDATPNITGITVNEYGMYAALDGTSGRIFVYNFEGELLFVFGGSGSTEGRLVQPGDISWLGDRILVSDRQTGKVSVFHPTKFGQKVIDATKAYYVGDWDNVGDNWLDALKLNSNYDIAYVGYGKMLYMQDEYEESLEYFKLGNNRNYYSLAYKKYRAEVLSENFLLFISPVIILVGIVVISEFRYNRKEGGE